MSRTEELCGTTGTAYEQNKERKTLTQALNADIDRAYAGGNEAELDAFLELKARQWAKHDVDATAYIMERLPKKLAGYDPNRVGESSGKGARFSTFLTDVLDHLCIDWWRKTQADKLISNSDEIESLGDVVAASDRRRNGRRDPRLGCADLFDCEEDLLDEADDDDDADPVRASVFNFRNGDDGEDGNEGADNDDDDLNLPHLLDEDFSQPNSGVRCERVEPDSDRESQHRWWKQALRVRETGANDEQMVELLGVELSAVRPTLSRFRRKLREAEQR